MKRCFKLLGIENLIAKLKKWQPEYPKPTIFADILAYTEAICAMIYFSKKKYAIKLAA
ncbi:MAG: hypothetical protein R2760_02305 [Chitinophagales bacterium]